MIGFMMSVLGCSQLRVNAASMIMPVNLPQLAELRCGEGGAPDVTVNFVAAPIKSSGSLVGNSFDKGGRHTSALAGYAFCFYLCGLGCWHYAVTRSKHRPCPWVFCFAKRQ